VILYSPKNRRFWVFKIKKPTNLFQEKIRTKEPIGSRDLKKIWKQKNQLIPSISKPSKN
jgi:uncharacterized protein YjiK